MPNWARAGLGDQFFSSVVRDKRRPKLTNFLKALTAIIDVADELLFDVENRGGHLNQTPTTPDIENNHRIESDHFELFLFAKMLGQLVRKELDILEHERPNDPEKIRARDRQRDLLTIFATGFERIANALAPLEESGRQPMLLAKAREVVTGVGNQINEWFRKNGAEVIDWGIRLPVFAAGVAMLGWAGADMTVATSAVAAVVGGTKIIGVLRKGKN